MSRLNKNVVSLGLVSFFNDIASEIVIRLLPLYLLQILKTQIVVIGAIEAISESLGVMIRPFSGTISDHFRRRKSLVVVGYGLSALTRPFIILLQSPVSVMIVRMLDRVGKGIRTAPRDALISEWSQSDQYGRSFSFHRALDTGGAVLGLGLVGSYFALNPISTEKSIPAILTIATIAGLVAFFILVVLVSESPEHKQKAPTQEPLTLKKLLHFHSTPELKKYLGAIFVFSLASSSDGFLIIRASELGLGIPQIFLLVAGFNLVSATSAVPIGALSDKIGRKGILVSGWIIYGISYVIFAHSGDNLTLFLSAFIFYGLFYGFTEGVERAIIADLTPAQFRGRAFGLLGLVNGLGLLLANIFCGIVYQKYGPSAAFWTTAGLSALAVIWVFFIQLRPSTSSIK